MADWRELVRQGLAGLRLDAAEKQEVHEEFVAHLEDSYESLRKQGLPEREAEQRALAQVADWQELQRAIFIEKGGAILMHKRLQQLWIPGFLTMILSTFSLMAAQTGGFQPPILWGGSRQILVYVPWLVTLPFFGALGAYVSWRAGGSRGAVLLSSVFPSLALALAFLLMFPIDLIVKWIMGMEINFGIVATAILRDGIGWLLLPAAALLAGGLLAQFLLCGPSPSPETASRS